MKSLKSTQTVNHSAIPIVLMFFSLLVCAHGVEAQDTTRTEVGLTVNCSPPGATVKLDGAAALTGVAPVFFSQGIPGKYEMEVSKPGYESYKTTVFISNSRSAQLDVRLDPKTRGKAAIRSLFLPGWGQLYSGQKSKGIIMASLALVSAGALVAAELRYQDKFDEYEDALNAYNSAKGSGSIDDIQELEPRLRRTQADAYDAETVRYGAFGAAVAVWGISFLDALFFFPNLRDDGAPGGISLRPDVDPLTGYTGVKLHAGFEF